MKKKFSAFFIFLACAVLFGCFSGFTKKTAFADQTFDIKSKSAYLCDGISGSVIYAKNENERLPIASMCKIMTLLLSFEEIDNGNLKLDEQIVVSSNASGMGGSQVFLEANASYSAGELIKGIVVASANDACVAMAERISGTEQAFIEKMNNRASELGMTNTNFVNCTGLQKPGQYSSAKDVAKMFCELIKHQDYFRFSRIWTDRITHPNDRITEISNTNKLVRFYQGCDGGKTGYTAEAGHCLSACATRNGVRLISVVISAPDSKTRFKEVSSMFNYGFANFTNKLVVDNQKILDVEVKVLGGKKDRIEVVPERPYYIFSPINQKVSVECDFKPIIKVVAPINKGDVVGQLLIFKDGIQVDAINVLSNECVLKKTYFDYIKNIGEKWALIDIS
ncbi:MAG: D-alanyl-D-alanine carboxypeptidase [Clostridia bacterium]|nr:D-alanyl-D-alanine carboxypeptidase [Clostridia bacterium]